MGEVRVEGEHRDRLLHRHRHGPVHQSVEAKVEFLQLTNRRPRLPTLL